MICTLYVGVTVACEFEWDLRGKIKDYQGVVLRIISYIWTLIFWDLAVEVSVMVRIV